MDDFLQGRKPEEPASVNEVRSPQSNQSPALESLGAVAAHAEKSSNDKPPDIAEVIKTWSWRLAIEIVGERWAMAGLVAVFICCLIWEFYADIKTIFSDAQTFVSEHRRLPEAGLDVFTWRSSRWTMMKGPDGARLGRRPA